MPPKQKDLFPDRKTKKLASSKVRRNGSSTQKSTNVRKTFDFLQLRLALLLIHIPVQTDSSDLEETAITTLERQRIELCNQAEQLVQRTMSLYDIGFSLGIVPANPRLHRHLDRAFQSLRSLQLEENAYSGDDDEEDDSSENGEF